jgi:hypothetical protein
MTVLPSPSQRVGDQHKSNLGARPHPHRVIRAVSALMMVRETTVGPEAGQPASPWWVLAMQEASDRMERESVPVAEAVTLAR